MGTTLHRRRVTSSAETIDLREHQASTESPSNESRAPDTRRARLVWAVLRISLGWIFLWAFLDKTFSLGAATESDNAWIDGGSPTEGYLSFATRGPLKDWFDRMAGLALVNAGDTWGLGRWWSRQPAVRKYPVLR